MNKTARFTSLGLADRPTGYQHTGQFGLWNVADRLPTYAVVAQTESDFVATVKFA